MNAVHNDSNRHILESSENKSNPVEGIDGAALAPYNFFTHSDRGRFPAIVNENVATIPFLNAVEDFLGIYDSFGSIFVLVKMDMANNIEKLRLTYKKNPTEHEYIRELLITDKKEGKRFAASSLLWLNRGLDFCIQLVQQLQLDAGSVDKRELKQHVEDIYERVLKKYHGWFTRASMKVAGQTLPSRSVVCQRLWFCGDGHAQPSSVYEDEVRLYSDGCKYIEPLVSLVVLVKHMFIDLNLDTEEAVR